MKVIQCYMTKTRLMGTIAGYICYIHNDNRYVEFYHIEYEEYGIDRFEQFINPSEYQIKEMSLEMFGGLGGQLVEIDKKHFDQLIIAGIVVDKQSDILHSAMAQSAYIQQIPAFNADDFQASLDSVIEVLRSSFEIIHYFLMRYFGGDLVYMRFASCDITPLEQQYSLVRNHIEKIDDSNYKFSALILAKEYAVFEGVISIEDGLINAFEPSGEMIVSDIEAALMLKQKEYIHVYDVDAEYVEPHLLREHKYLAPMLFANGRLYTSYRKHNNHVNCSTFYLNGDVEAYIYITDSEQLLVVSNDRAALAKWDEILNDRFIDAVDKYEEWEFEETILYDFIESEYVDFDDFISAI